MTGTARLLPVMLEGAAGPIEALLQERDEHDHTLVAVVCHPHPLYGGTLDNKVAQTLARACGKNHLHNLEPEDLVAVTIEAAAMAKVPLAGTSWIPGAGGI